MKFLTKKPSVTRRRSESTMSGSTPQGTMTDNFRSGKPCCEITVTSAGNTNDYPPTALQACVDLQCQQRSHLGFENACISIDTQSGNRQYFPWCRLPRVLTSRQRSEKQQPKQLNLVQQIPSQRPQCVAPYGQFVAAHNMHGATSGNAWDAHRLQVSDA